MGQGGQLPPQRNWIQCTVEPLISRQCETVISYSQLLPTLEIIERLFGFKRTFDEDSKLVEAVALEF